MITDLKPYPEMKDSGIPWLGEVPAHWRQLPGRTCYSEKKIPNRDMRGKIVLSLSYGQIKIKAPDKLHGLVPESFETYQIVDPGDIVVRPTDLQNDRNSLRFGISRHCGIITSAYMCLHTKELMSRKYGHMLLHTYDLKKVFYGLGSGLRQNLDWKDFKYLPCLVPPQEEQAVIARYLDSMDRRIRKYIRAKQKLIKLLEEQKQAIIHRAVTRGLDTNVRLKPSGVEWLGDVPEHWEVLPLRRLLSFGPKNGVSPPPSSIGCVLTMSISAVRDGCVEIVGNEKYVDIAPQTVEQFRIQPGDILLVRGNGSPNLVGKCGIVTDCRDTCIYPDILMKLRPNALILPRFLVHAINSPYVRYQVRGLAKTASGIFKISGSSVCSFQIVVPPRCEQDDILYFLENSLLKIDVGRENARREIFLLREYRTRLIADVVTGKLDVREAATKLPAEADETEPIDDIEEPTENGTDDPIEEVADAE